MRIVVTLDSERTEVDVTPDGTSARWPAGGATVKIVRVAGRVAELEIAGERVLIEGWPEYLPEPPTEIIVNGETFRLTIERRGTETPSIPPPSPPSRAPPGANPSTVPAGPGAVVTPPMPGRVVELRVHDGERVAVGQVLLVIEAMKMRNEVTSPASGVVRGLSVAAGANVRAHEPMLRIAPE